MNYIEIKSHRTDGVVKVEMYDTDTDGVSGLAIEASDLWRWLSQCRPCQVRLRGRDYLLPEIRSYLHAAPKRRVRKPALRYRTM